MPDFKKPITINGVTAIGANGVAPVAAGGTNISSYSAGDILYASGTTTLSKLAAAAAGNVLISGTSPSWGKVALTTHVSGVLPTANGGTNVDIASASLTVFGLNVGGGSGAATGEIRAVLSTNGSPTNVIQNSNSGSSAFSYLRIANNTDNTSGILRNSSANTAFAGANSMALFQQGNYPISIVTNNTLRVTVAGGGDVTIANSLIVTTGLNVGASLSAAAGEIRTSYSVNGSGSSYIRNTNTGASAYGALYIGNNTDVTSGLIRNSSNNSGYAGANSLSIANVGNYPLGFVTNNVLRMSIDGAGDIRFKTSAHPVRSSGTALFGLDGTDEGSALTLANDATGTPFSNANVFSGFFIVTGTVGTNQSALFLSSGGVITLVSQTGSDFSTTINTASKVNVYLTSSILIVQNKTGLSVTLNIVAVRTKTSQ